MVAVGEVVLVRVVASHFLWNQVRRMVGALVTVGRGEALPAAVRAWLDGSAPPPALSAPAAGLFLEAVLYRGERWTLPPLVPVGRAELPGVARRVVGLGTREAAWHSISRKLFVDVFDPQPDEMVVVACDLPRRAEDDTPEWADRRAMAAEWRQAMVELGRTRGFSTLPLLTYPATGANNAELPHHGHAGGPRGGAGAGHPRRAPWRSS